MIDIGHMFLPFSTNIKYSAIGKILIMFTYTINKCLYANFLNFVSLYLLLNF